MIPYHSIHSSWHKLKFWKWYENSNLPLLVGERVLPPLNSRFRALELGVDDVKIVILGQDPYHTKGMAHGLAFSVQPHIKSLPPSLRNIFKELQTDLGLPEPRSGDLRPWAERGILLLNTVLTVEQGKPGSHKGIGWEKLCYEVVRKLGDKQVGFLLMGKQAQEYKAATNGSPCVSVPHPSPLSKGFLGSKPFSQINDLIGTDVNIWRL